MNSKKAVGESIFGVKNPKNRYFLSHAADFDLRDKFSAVSCKTSAKLAGEK